MRRLPKPAVSVWRAVWRFSSLVHGYDDVRLTYGDNPNGLSDEERLIARALASNTASLPGGGSAF
jgi:hypothetical protein